MDSLSTLKHQITQHRNINMTREQIIHNMCMTFRHDYGLEISEDDRMYTLMSGMTKLERQGLYRSMSQIFDNDIAPYMEFKHKINNETDS